jgi:hypothetical protein
MAADSEVESFTNATKPTPDGALISIQAGPSAYRPHTLALLFHCIPAFLQSALVKGCALVT